MGQPAVRLRFHGTADPGDAGRRHLQPRHARRAGGGGALEPQGRGCGQVLRRLPRRRGADHARRGGPLSGLRYGEPAARSTWTSASSSAGRRTRRPRLSRWESEEILALSAYVGHQSRGMPVRSGRTRGWPVRSRAGDDAFQRRQGQLNFSCADCHDGSWGRQLGGSVIPQGHATGLPALPAGMAVDGVASAALAQLHGGSPGGTLLLWLAGIRRAGALPDVAVARHAGGDARRSTVSALPFGAGPRNGGGRDTQLPKTSQPPRHATVVPPQPGGRRSRPQFQVWRTVFH